MSHDPNNSETGRSGYERDAYDRDSALGDSDYYGYSDGQVRGWTWISWLAIFSLIVFMLVLRDAAGRKPQELPPPLDDTAASMHGLFELQGRIIVGVGELQRQLPGANPNDIKKLVEGENPDDPQEKQEHLSIWAQGTFGQRLQGAVIVGELSGPDNAIALLNVLELQLNNENLVLSDEQRSLKRSLEKVYVDFKRQKFDAPSLKDPERALLLSKLGWHGRLALTPPEAPDRVAREAVVHGPLQFCIALLVGLLVMAVLGVLGLLIYLGLTVAAAAGSLKFGIRPGTPASGVYAETFALWLIGFFGAQMALELVPFPQSRLTLLLVIMLGSLLVLIWPVLRGIPFRQVRQDLGLTWGRAGIAEPFMGLPGYSLMLPLLAMGAAIMIGIVFLTLNGQPQNAPADGSAFDAIQNVPHPAVADFLKGDRWAQLQLIILACVAAPIVEEIMFRGVLYRHLRDASRGWGCIISGLFSAFVMSFVFAVIHPQPPVAIPALMGIALGCTFVREWRDSLWASMVVHAINNGLVFTLLYMATL